MPLKKLIRPLAEIPPEPSLLGSDGLYRAPIAHLQINASNDLEAMFAFLSEYSESPGTLRQYTRECERLFLWAWTECAKPVSSLTRQDFEGYMNFLADPQPAEVWCGPKAPRKTERWRPFVGPIEEKAVMGAVAAINSLMTYWVDSGYVTGNPLGLIRQRRKKLRGITDATSSQQWVLDQDAKVERFLDPDMWNAVTLAIDGMPEDTIRQTEEKERLRFIISFLYMLGPRASELEHQRMNSFREERGLWWWYVIGKGDKRAKVPVPDDMVQALVKYRKFRGLSAVPSSKDMSPLLVSIKDGTPITARRLNQILKQLFKVAADLLTPDLEYKREKLVAASAHWGRHTSITARVDSGMNTTFVQKDARHVGPRTTNLYIHSEDERWHEESQKLRLKWNEGE